MAMKEVDPNGMQPKEATVEEHQNIGKDPVLARPLHVALRHRSLGVVRAILATPDLDPNARNADGMCAIHLLAGPHPGKAVWGGRADSVGMGMDGPDDVACLKALLESNKVGLLIPICMNSIVYGRVHEYYRKVFAKLKLCIIAYILIFNFINNLINALVSKIIKLSFLKADFLRFLSRS